jgi:hypothetical protein
MRAKGSNMLNKIAMKYLAMGLLAICAQTAMAQPGDEQVKKDAIGQGGSGVKSVRLTKATGTRQWNSGIGNWEYVRGVEVLRKSEYPGIDLLVTGDVVYQYTGAGKYSYWKFRVIDNGYSGIPNPTPQEIQDFISKDWQKFYGNYYYTVITKVHRQPVLADTPRWFWHSPKQVSFKMKLQFDHIIFNSGIETLDCVWDVRLYRDEIKGPWMNMLALRSEEAADIKVLGFKKQTPEQLQLLQRQTLQYTMAEQRAQQDRAALPQVALPAFANEEAMARYLHGVLVNGNAQQWRAVLLQVMHPGFFESGSKVQLLAVQEQNLKQAIMAAFENRATYQQMYCLQAPVRVDNYADGRKAFYFSGAVANCNSYFIIGKANMGYQDGVPQQGLKLFEYGINVRQDDDAVAYVQSFGNRKKLCPND